MRKQRAILIGLLVAQFVAGQQTDRLEQIRSVITEINRTRSRFDFEAFSRLFAPEGVLSVGAEIVANGPGAIAKALGKQQIWSETTAPVIRVDSLRLASPDQAVVDAVQTQVGSLILKQTAMVTLVLKREGAQWRIYSMRIARPDWPLLQISDRLY